MREGARTSLTIIVGVGWWVGRSWVGVGGGWAGDDGGRVGERERPHVWHENTTEAAAVAAEEAR